MKPILSKRGQLGGLSNSIIILVIAAIFLVLGVVILSEMQKTDIVSDVLTTTITGEAQTMTGSAVNLDHAGLCQSVCTITTVTNSTGTAINSANYTLVADDCTLVNTTSEFIEAWEVNYTVTHGDTACTSTNDTITGLATFADFWEIIILAIVITIVIGLLLVAFGSRRVR